MKQLWIKIVDYAANTIVGLVVIASLGWSWAYFGTHPWAAAGLGGGSLLIGLLWYVHKRQPWLVPGILRFPAALTQKDLQQLVRFSEKLYFAFTPLCNGSDFGRVLQEMLWRWHCQSIFFLRLYEARDSRASPAKQRKAISYLVANRKEFTEFYGEPADTLLHIAMDGASANEIRAYAKAQLDRLREVGGDTWLEPEPGEHVIGRQDTKDRDGAADYQV